MSAGLFEALAAQGIRLRNLNAGRTEHIVCPRCEGGNHRETSLSVSVDPDGRGAVWVCHRGTCGWRDAISLDEKPFTKPPAKPIKPLADRPINDQGRPEWFYAFWADRKIGKRTLDHFGVYAAMHKFGPPISGERPAIVFPYRHGGALHTLKFRPFPDKSPQSQNNSGLPVLFNADVLQRIPEKLVWVEGEPDVLAMHECGVHCAVSLRDGASKVVKVRDDDLRFAALGTHHQELALIKLHYLAGDADAAGTGWRETLARRLGRHKIKLVTWPEGCKDAGDVLRVHGPEAVQEALRAATFYPIEGLQRINENTLDELFSMPRPETMSIGTDADPELARIKLPVEGRLIVVTGFPQHGKTAWTRFVAMHTITRHGRRWLIFSPEQQPWSHFVAECAEVHVGKPFWPRREAECMGASERRDASAYLSDRLFLLACDVERHEPTVDWLIEGMRMAVLRYGITDTLLDPWNEIEHTRGDMNETDYVGRTLQRLKGFATEYGCNVWIVAHPSKPPPLRAGEKHNPPGGYDISGSANWYNRPDLGLTVWIPGSGDVVELRLWKRRFSRWGDRNAVVHLKFDATCGRYSPFSQEA